MAFKMDEVLPKLFIGNIVNSADLRHLKEFEISKILSVYEFARKRHCDREYLLIKVCDKDTENLSQYFTQSNDFIHEARLNSTGVLVHCIKGASRSATLVLAYIMSVTELNLKDAFIFLKRKRSIINPNKGFMRQLEEFEKNGVAAERLRLKQCFQNDADLRLADQREIFCPDVPSRCAEK